MQCASLDAGERWVSGEDKTKFWIVLNMSRRLGGVVVTGGSTSHLNVIVLPLRPTCYHIRKRITTHTVREYARDGKGEEVWERESDCQTDSPACKQKKTLA